MPTGPLVWLMDTGAIRFRLELVLIEWTACWSEMEMVPTGPLVQLMDTGAIQFCLELVLVAWTAWYGNGSECLGKWIQGYG